MTGTADGSYTAPSGVKYSVRSVRPEDRKYPVPTSRTARAGGGKIVSVKTGAERSELTASGERVTEQGYALQTESGTFIGGYTQRTTYAKQSEKNFSSEEKPYSQEPGIIRAINRGFAAQAAKQAQSSSTEYAAPKKTTADKFYDKAFLAEEQRQAATTPAAEAKYAVKGAAYGYAGLATGAGSALKTKGQEFVGGIATGAIFEGGTKLLLSKVKGISGRAAIKAAGPVLGGIYVSSKTKQFVENAPAQSSTTWGSGQVSSYEKYERSRSNLAYASDFAAGTTAEVVGFGVGAKTVRVATTPAKFSVKNPITGTTTFGKYEPQNIKVPFTKGNGQPFLETISVPSTERTAFAQGWGRRGAVKVRTGVESIDRRQTSFVKVTTKGKGGKSESVTIFDTQELPAAQSYPKTWASTRIPTTKSDVPFFSSPRSSRIFSKDVPQRSMLLTQEYATVTKGEGARQQSSVVFPRELEKRFRPPIYAKYRQGKQEATEYDIFGGAQAPQQRSPSGIGSPSYRLERARERFRSMQANRASQISRQQISVVNPGKRSVTVREATIFDVTARRQPRGEQSLRSTQRATSRSIVEYKPRSSERTRSLFAFGTKSGTGVASRGRFAQDLARISPEPSTVTNPREPGIPSIIPQEPTRAREVTPRPRIIDQGQYRPKTEIPPPPTVTGGFGLPIGPVVSRGRGRRENYKSSRKYGYAPSITAIVGNIRGKQKGKLLTGWEVRGL